MTYYKHHVVDGFFEDPSIFSNLAQKCDYPHNAGNYPGVRTDNLYYINESLFNLSCKKLLSVCFNYTVTANCCIRFQKIDNLSDDPKSAYNEGWIHIDSQRPGTHLTGIVYLNSDLLDVGTNLYSHDPVDKILGAERIVFPFYSGEHVDEDVYAKAIRKSNSIFKLDLEVKNKYNRMFCYDGFTPHGVPNYYMENGPRNTLIYFLKDIMVGQKKKCHTPSPEGTWVPYTNEVIKR